ncbi:LOW QUALITY PROTEIN: hypothetical protein TorRG33x02_022950, partial [Trema orientale]
KVENLKPFSQANVIKQLSNKAFDEPENLRERERLTVGEDEKKKRKKKKSQ